MGIEIEKKFTVKELPQDLDSYPFHVIEQAYLNVNPAIRIRRQDDIFYMTYKSKKTDGDAASEHSDDAPIGQTEYNLPLDEDSYNHMLPKADGNIISKRRYLIPINDDAFTDADRASIPGLNQALSSGDIKIELDVFEGPFKGRIVAEVEFPSEEAARAYKNAPWFDEEVTSDLRYSNAYMSRETLE